ncbi:MAG: alanine racemase [Pseudomonadota bacterium]|jgi:alanine racemase
MSHRIRALIDRRALAHNLSVARRHAGGAGILAMIKANAYGHGLVPVAEALHDADIFGVTDIDEAEQLRAGGTDRPILILQGIIDRSEIARIALQGFQVVIHRVEHLTWLEEELVRLTLPAPLTFWLKLDSGMGRLGIAPEDFAAACRKLQARSWCAGVVAMTHLANSSLPDSPLNRRQLDCFTQRDAELRYVPHATSIAASAALLALQTQADWARPGIMLYGSSPFAWTDVARRREAFDLKNVMTLEARLLHVAEHRTGDNIGYNSQFVCPRPMRVGIVSCGYADGYPSNTPNGGPVAICGRRTTTLGRVSMDMLAIDLTAIPEAEPGIFAQLWGDLVSIDEVAAHTGVISYNLSCSLSNRVPRTYS